jgi:predicted O-methyltransferase YrrM
VADKFFQLKSFFTYWLDAVDEHSLHSPFFFDFYTKVIKTSSSKNSVAAIERLRHKLLADHRAIETKDPGSGKSTRRKTIASIAHTSISPVGFSDLYARIINYIKAQTIIELGTSFGINTLYIAQKKDTQVTTFEGSTEIADIARLTFQFYGSRNISLVEGNISDTLAFHLQSSRKVDFALMDANHRYEPTVNYFQQLLPRLKETSVVAVDDIHYSPAMEQAWEFLKNHKLVYGSADLYRCGILFFDPSLNKQHVILQH